MLFFFLSGLCLQQWAGQTKQANLTKSGVEKIRPLFWLASGFLFFGLCLLAYEAASFIFPALLFLAWPLVQHPTKKDRARAIGNFIALGVVGVLFVLVPYFIYSVFTPFRAHLLDDFSLSFFLSAIRTFFPLLRDFGSWLPSPWPYFGAAILGSALVFSGGLVVAACRKPTAFDLKVNEGEKLVCVYLSCVLLVLGGIIPFALVGIGGPRAYHAVIFALPPVMLVGFGLVKRRFNKSANISWQKWALAAWSFLISLTLLLGLIQFNHQSNLLTESEFEENLFFLEMQEIIPAVKPETIFIFIDRSFSSSGCGPSLNMLYDQVGLRCASFSAQLTEFRAIRFTQEIIANRGGRLGSENWIIIRTDENGKPQIVPQLEYGDYDLIITWYNFEPIKTDYRRIIDEPRPPSDFYLYLLERQEFLSSRQ